MGVVGIVGQDNQSSMQDSRTIIVFLRDSPAKFGTIGKYEYSKYEYSAAVEN